MKKPPLRVISVTYRLYRHVPTTGGGSTKPTEPKLDQPTNTSTHEEIGDRAGDRTRPWTEQYCRASTCIIGLALWCPYPRGVRFATSNGQYSIINEQREPGDAPLAPTSLYAPVAPYSRQVTEKIVGGVILRFL